MWKKVGRGLGLKKGEALRFSFEVQVLQVDGLPPEAHGRNCRVVLNRSAKVDFTDEKEIRPTGVVLFRQTLSMVGTMQKVNGRFDKKDYSLKVQVPLGRKDEWVTLGKADVDMSEYVDDVKCGPRRCALDVAFKGAGEPGTIKLMISSTPLGPAGAEDSMSDVTGLTSDAGPALMEQDLKGFENKIVSKRGGSTRQGDAGGGPEGSAGSGASVVNKRVSSKPAAMPTLDEGEDDGSEEDGGVSEFHDHNFGKRKSPSSASSSAAAAADPVFGKKKTPPAAAGAADPFFGKKKVEKESTTTSGGTGGTTGRRNGRAAKRLEEEDEDISPMNSDLDEDAPPKPSKAALPSTSAAAATAAAAAATTAAATAAAQGNVGATKPSAYGRGGDTNGLASTSSATTSTSGASTGAGTGAGAGALTGKGQGNAAGQGAGAGGSAGAGARSKDALGSIYLQDYADDGIDDGSTANRLSSSAAAPGRKGGLAPASTAAAVDKGDRGSGGNKGNVRWLDQEQGKPSVATGQGKAGAAAAAGAGAAAAEAEAERLRAQMQQLAQQLQASQQREAQLATQVNDLKAGSSKAAIEIQGLREQIDELEDECESLRAELEREKVARQRAEQAATAAAAAAAGAASSASAARGRGQPPPPPSPPGASDEEVQAALAEAAKNLSKYNKLKEKFQELQDSSQEEIDELSAQLEDAREHIRALESTGASASGGNGGNAAGGRGRQAEQEAHALAEDNAVLLEQLVKVQVELAQQSQEQDILRRELVRAKEVNLKLAAKMTKLEEAAAKAGAKVS